MITASIVQEVRDIREREAGKHNYDLLEIASHIKIHEQELPRQGWNLKERIVNKKDSCNQPNASLLFDT
jgi:hypothetical protein